MSPFCASPRSCLATGSAIVRTATSTTAMRTTSCARSSVAREPVSWPPAWSRIYSSSLPWKCFATCSPTMLQRHRRICLATGAMEPKVWAIQQPPQRPRCAKCKPKIWRKQVAMGHRSQLTPNCSRKGISRGRITIRLKWEWALELAAASPAGTQRAPVCTRTYRSTARGATWCSACSCAVGHCSSAAFGVR